MNDQTKEKLKEKLNVFKNSVTGKKTARGYAQLSGLDQRLLEQDHGPNTGFGFAPQEAGYQGPSPGGYGAPPPGTGDAGAYTQPGGAAGAAGAAGEAPVVRREHMADVPSMSEELVTLTTLSTEASSLLWETVAMMRGGGPPDPDLLRSTEELLENGELLEKQLRGLIQDCMASEGVPEAALGQALAALDALQNTKNEYLAQLTGSGPTDQAPPPEPVDPGPGSSQPQPDFLGLSDTFDVTPHLAAGGAGPSTSAASAAATERVPVVLTAPAPAPAASPSVGWASAGAGFGAAQAAPAPLQPLPPQPALHFPYYPPIGALSVSEAPAAAAPVTFAAAPASLVAPAGFGVDGGAAAPQERFTAVAPAPAPPVPAAASLAAAPLVQGPAPAARAKLLPPLEAPPAAASQLVSSPAAASPTSPLLDLL